MTAPDFSGLTLRDLSHSIVAQLESLGIRVPESSRFRAYQRVLGDRDPQTPTIIPFESPDFPIAQQGHADLVMMAQILERLATPGSSGRVLEQLQRAVQDAPVQTWDAADTPGRDAELELYVASRCVFPGTSADLVEPPDIRIEGKHGPMGIACKRIKSYSSLENRVRGARNQILRSGIPGVICLDISMMLDHSPLPAVAPISESSVMNSMASLFRGFIAEHEGIIRRSWVGETTWVRGIILLCHLAMCQPDRNWEAVLNTVAIPLADHHEERRRQFLAFVRDFNETASGTRLDLPTPSPGRVAEARQAFSRQSLSQFARDRTVTTQIARRKTS